MTLDAIAVIVFIVISWLGICLMCIHGDAKWAAEQEKRNDG